MDIIPAIDLKSGKCVRLLQGRDDATTEYSANPLAVAEEWERQGAGRIHVVNLDGAFGRVSGNLEVLRQITGGVRARVQFGGGLRNLHAMDEALTAGVSKIVLGTVAVDDPALLRSALARYGAERVIVALDAVGGKVATRGWRVVSNESILDLARTLHAGGVEEVLYTDIERDGMLTGPDLVTLRELATTGMQVLSSGGVSSVADIRAIAGLKQDRISGVIVGKALYERRVTLRDLISNSQFPDPSSPNL